MDFWQLYSDWYLNYRNEFTWIDYYNSKFTDKFKRESKQRNYKRNGDIIYDSNASKRNNSITGIEIIPIKSGDLYLDGQYLKLRYEDSGYSSDFTVDKIRPYNYLTMWVDNELNLVADMPNLLLDKSFFIDYNVYGNLVLTDEPTKIT